MIQNSPWHNKIISKIFPDPLKLKEILDYQHKNKIIVLVKGVYDLFHSGHYYSFINARKYGDILVVAVNSDNAVKNRKGDKRPIIDQNERMLIVASLECVDYVALYKEESPYDVLDTIRPNVFAASHFDSIRQKDKMNLKKYIDFQIVPKLGGNSTSNIVQKISASYSGK